jgi:hypothetical protein
LIDNTNQELHVSERKMYFSLLMDNLCLKHHQEGRTHSFYQSYWWWKKLVWVSVISFGKIFILSYTFDALLRQNWLFSSPNRLTLGITLLYEEKEVYFPT